MKFNRIYLEKNTQSFKEVTFFKILKMAQNRAVISYSSIAVGCHRFPPGATVCV
jgi:hypothetical protein